MTFRLYRAFPQLRPVALLDIGQGVVRVEKNIGLDQLVSKVETNPRQGVALVRAAVASGTYLLTRHDPEDAFFREANVVHPDRLLSGGLLDANLDGS